MADINHAHAAAPVESDGVSYSGIIWFVVILTATTLFCQALVWGMFVLFARHATAIDPPRAPLSAPAANPAIEAGHVVTGTTVAPQPGLLVGEPTVLHEFRQKEDRELTTYGWVDKGLNTVHIPIDRAKDLLLERGLPVRAADPAGAPATVRK